MIPIALTTDIDSNRWDDIRPSPSELGLVSRVGRLTNGTVLGQSVVMVAIKMADGTEVVGQTTMNNFLAAAKVMAAADGRSLND